MKVVSVYSRRLGIINQVNVSLAERSIVPRECAIDRAHLRQGIVSELKSGECVLGRALYGS